MKTWKLSLGVACGLAVYALSAVTFQATLVIVSAHVSGRESGKVLLIDSLRLVNSTLSAAGIASYILVSYRTERPKQLHTQGVVLILMLIADIAVLPGKMMIRQRIFIPGWALMLVNSVTYGARKLPFFQLLAEKLEVLGPPRGYCQDVRLCSRALIASTLLTISAGGTFWLLGIVMRWRGSSIEDPGLAAHQPPEDVLRVETLLMRLTFLIAMTGTAMFVVAGLAVMIVASRLGRATVKKLACREVSAEMLAKVQSTLWQHLLGVIVSTVSSFLTIVATFIDAFDAFGGDEADEDIANVLAAVLDHIGDIAGVLLLSGIGLLLFREDPEAGDINGHIRSLLRATVLTSRADNVFEGHVINTPSNMCIVSFPGKFIEDWKVLTWLCEQRELSSACVFLPTSDPMQRFGRHAMCPEDPGRCWCYSLYGEQKPWGCLWFEAWKANVDKAVELGLDMVAVFFPGETGNGVVEWDDLQTADLWDGVGLGGSQKAEVAYLRREGIPVVLQDLQATRRLYLDTSCSVKPSIVGVSSCAE